MGLILNAYKKVFVNRFDKDGITPYYSCSDFPGLNCKKNSFTNSKGIKIEYFVYYYENYKTNKMILFCHGIGPGHTAYLKEIEKLCKNGYCVLTLDYTGCAESEGENLISVNEPTRDVDELLKEMDVENIKDVEIIVIGHSLGAYTALNTVNIHPYIKKAIIISGFYSYVALLKASAKLPFNCLYKDVIKYENEMNKEYASIDNIKYLKDTTDKILFIHSKDDTMVPYKKTTKYIMKKVKNDNIKYLIVDGKCHNPNYEEEAVKYMRQTFSTLHKIKDIEEKKKYMASRDISLMTKQDDNVFKEIFEFIEK